MRQLFGRALDFLTSEPLRIRSFLRLVLIALIALLVYHSNVAHRFESAFNAVLVAYAIAAVLWLIFVLRGPTRWWFGWASTFADVAIVLALLGVDSPASLALAWAYVVLRVIHSLFQALVNTIPIRFVLFVASNVPLFALTAIAAIELLKRSQL